MYNLYICHKCNSQVNLEAKFCSNCDTHFNPITSTIPPGKELDHMRDMLARSHKLMDKKLRRYRLEIEGWIRSDSRTEARERLEDYFSSMLAHKCKYSTEKDNLHEVRLENIQVPYREVGGIELHMGDAFAEITSTQLKVL